MEHQKCGTIKAATMEGATMKANMKANMTPKTASKYIHSGVLPSAQIKESGGGGG